MRHARPDYNRIQDPAGLIPEDEPVFLLRGQDRMAAAVVSDYADELEAAGGDPVLVAMARAHADRMAEWARVYGKMPDATPEQLGGGARGR